MGRSQAGMAAALALAALLIAGAAEAKTKAHLSGNTAYAETGRGSSDRNNVKVGYDAAATELIITDTRAGVKAEAPCTKESATEARCPAAGIIYMYVATFQGNDNITMQTGGANPFPSAGINPALTGGLGQDRVKGGDSTDTVNGGQGDDVVIGGGGVDYLYGVSGEDVLRADDGQADQKIDCGTGDDPTPLFDLGIDPTPERC